MRFYSHNEDFAPKEYIDNFTNFMKYNRISIRIVLIMIFLTYGFMLFHFNFSIDTEDIIVKQMTFYNGWIGINRYGLVFTKWLTGVLNIVPGFATVLMVLTTLGYSLAWMYFFYWIKGNVKSSLSFSWIFPVLFFSSVPIIELTNFQCLSFEVAFAMLICAVSLLFEWQWILDGKKTNLLLSVLFGVWCFASYQAFVPVYISASLVSFLLGYQYRGEEIQNHVFLVSFKLLGVFLCDCTIYILLGKVLMRILGIPAGMYTENMILWGKKPVQEIILNLKKYICDVVFARNVFWNKWYFFAVVFLLLIALWNIELKFKESRFYQYYILVLVLLLVSPFFLPVLMGAEPVTRGQLAVPFVTAIGTEMIVQQFAERFRYRSFFSSCMTVLLILLIVRGNIVKDNRLLYSEYVTRQQEQALTERLIGKIAEAGGKEESTVVLIGKWSPVYNASMMLSETLGRSFYEWDQEIPGHTCKRVLNYWSVLGYNFRIPNDEQLKNAEIIAKQMPSWPQEGSVLCKDDLVVIKLSE